MFQGNGCISHFKVLTLSDNPLSNYYLDDASIGAANVEAMTTISDTRSDIIEEVYSLLMDNFTEDLEITLDEFIENFNCPRGYMHASA